MSEQTNERRSRRTSRRCWLMSADLAALLRAMQPVQNAGTFVFVSVPAATDLRGLDVVATMREAEGLSMVVREEQARLRGLSILFRAAWITLSVASDLQAVGLTAAVSTALA